MSKGKAAEGSLLPEEGGSGRLVNSPVTVIWAGCPGGALSAFVNILPAADNTSADIIVQNQPLEKPLIYFFTRANIWAGSNSFILRAGHRIPCAVVEVECYEKV